MRTYLYKLTSDRGGAPCAPPPRSGSAPLLTLAICKPAIRRTAKPGDCLIGLTSRMLEEKSGYPALSVIYAAKVTEIVDAAAYYAPRSPHRQRPDCIYAYDPDTGGLCHTGRTGLHADPRHRRRDLGREGIFENGRILLCREFTYLGPAALVLPESLHGLRRLASELGQGHRVVDPTRNPDLHQEIEWLLIEMGRQATRFTPHRVHADAYDRPAG